MGRTKYSFELKLEIVQKYLGEHIPVTKLVKMYQIDAGTIQQWIGSYVEHGEEGLTHTRQSYTGDFKVSVVEYMHDTGASARKTAAHFNVNAYGTVLDWEQIYEENGPAALYEEHRGKGAMMEAKRPRKPKQKKETDSDEDLLAEVKRLRMENEYLKKLNALVQEKENSRKKTK